MKDTNTNENYDTWLSKYGGYANSMTLRDYFAAKAMQGVLSFEAIDEYSAKDVAFVAYEMADALLKAREQE
jgi:hypothetical protein